MTTEPSQASEDLRKQLHKSEAVFRLLVSGVKDYAIFMLDPKGFVMTWNEGAQRIKGYTADEIIGQHFSKFYTDELKKAKHPDNELEIAKKDGSYEEEGWRVRKDGTLFWANVVITAIYDEGKLIGFAKVTRDLSERKKIKERERKAQQQEEVFSALVTGVRDYAIFMLDPDGIVMTWNEGAQRIKGYTADEIIGKHFSQFYPEDQKKNGHPEKELSLARKEGRYEEEGWRIRKDGNRFWASVLITAIYEGEELIGFAKVTRDLTERRLAEQQREADARMLLQTNEELQRALEIKSRFLSTISHEVRTPMGGIIGMTELLSLQDLGENTNDIVVSILDSSKRLLQLLNDMLDSARMESGKLTLEHRQFAIRAVLGDVRQLIKPDANRKGLTVNGTCESSVPELVCGDEFRLRQILLNLAFNAVKFTKKGSVSISCTVKESDENCTRLRFTIKDTGIGIAPEDQEKLFQPFEQAEDCTTRLYGGSGLGLSISKSLVELMDGKIGVESSAGEGATFWFEVPFNEGYCASV